MAKLLHTLPLIFLTHLAVAQIYEIDNLNGQTVNTCSGTLYDSGGQNFNYNANENYTVTFCPAIGSQGLIANFTSINIGANDQLCIYNGTTTATPLLACLNSATTGGITIGSSNTQGCLTFQFTSDNNAATVGTGWAASLSCQVTCQTVEAKLQSSTPAMNPPDTGYIDICEGDAVTFTATGIFPQNNLNYAQSNATSTFEWIIEGQTFTGQTITHTFNNPGGQRISLKVTDVNGCESTNDANIRVRVAPPPYFDGTSISDTTACLGDTITLYGNAIPNSEDFAASLARGDSIFLPDGNGVCYQTTLEFTDFGPTQTITSINDLVSICVNMEHSWIGDLDVTITCPNGNSVVLVPNPNNGGGLDLGIPISFGPGPGTGFDYCWTPTAPFTWNQAQANGLTVNTGGFQTALAPGNYASSQSLTGLIGCPLNGQWELQVCDNIPIDDGYIFSWGIELASYLYPTLDTFTPQITSGQWQVDTGIVQLDTFNYIINSTGTSSYTYTATNEFGCSFDTSITVITDIPPLKPSLSCGTTNASSITVSRSNVTGALAYEINVDNGGWQPFPSTNFTLSNLQPLQSVQFQLRAIGSGICQATSEIDTLTCMTADCQLTTNLDSITNISCNGLSDGVAYFSATTNLAPISYTLDNGTPQASGTFGNLGLGNHTVIIQDANTCKDTISFTITEPTVLTSTISETPVLCNGASDGTATVLPSGGTAPYTYQWSANASSQTTATASNLAAGTYDVTVYDANNCQTTNQITVTEPTALSLNMEKKDVNCFQENTGFAIAIPSGGVSGYTYQWSANANNQTTDTAFNLPIGTYSVTVTDVNNCVISNNITLTEPAILDITADTNRVTCFGTADGEAITTTTGGTAPYTYFWNVTNDTIPSPDTLSGGFHTVIVTDSLGCKDSVTVGIYEPPAIINTFTTTQVTCFGLSDGTATVSSSGGIGSTYTYLWGNTAFNQTTPTASGLPGGYFRVYVTDQENCTQFNDVFVFAPPLVFIDTITSTPTVCYESNEGTVSVTGIGGSGTLIYDWNNNVQGNSQSNLFAGQYTVTITDVQGCQAIDSIIVGRPDSIEMLFTPTQLLCNGDGTGAASVSVTGGTMPYFYNWSNSNATNNINNLQSGNYGLTITDVNGCTNLDTVFVPEPAVLTATATFVEPLCNGDANGSATIIPNGGNTGYSFSWNTSPVQNDTTATGLTAGTYTYSVTDSNNCFYQNTVTVTEPDALQLVMDSIPITCRDSANGVAIVTPVGGSYPFNYNWSVSSVNDSILNPLDTGNYSVTITDFFGCQAIGSVEVTQPTYITSSLSKTDLSCFESGDGTATVVAGGGVGNYTYFWNNGSQTAPIANNLDSGWAVITIYDNNNCPKMDSILIDQPTEIINTVSSTLTNCFGDNTGTATVSTTGGVGAITYTWNTSPTIQTGSTATNLFAGTYTVTATDFTGCTDIDTIVVGQPTQLVTSTFKTDMSCFNLSNGTANVIGTGGTVANDYTYLWSNGDMTDSTFNLTNIRYYVSVTDDNGCVTIDSVDIIEPPILASTISQTPASCFENNDGQAIIIVNGGTPDSLGNYMYNWNNTQITDTAFNLMGGATYSVTVTDANNCIHLDTVTIQHPDKLILSATTTNTSCDYTNDGTATVLPTGGTMPYFYNWTTNNQTTQTGVGLLKGNYITTVTDNNGCVETLVIAIDGPAPIVLDAKMVAALCKGDANGSLEASAIGGTPINGGYTYLWSDNQSDSLAVNLTAGLYQVTATDANNCIGIDSFEVTEPSFDLFPNATATDVSCFGEQDGIIRINPMGGTAPYRFSADNQIFNNVNNISGLSPGTYVYYVRDKNNCIEADTVTIEEPLPFSILMPTDTSITYPNEVIILPILQNGIPPFTYLWESQDSIIDCPDCEDLITDIGGYRTLTVVDSNGCEATASIFITVQRTYEIYIATGFTPNNDGTNDWLYVQGGIEVAHVTSFNVFDRWGEHVFTSSDIAPNAFSSGWNGDFQGQPAPSGVYAWTAEVEFSDGRVVLFKGSTTLVR